MLGRLLPIIALTLALSGCDKDDNDDAKLAKAGTATGKGAEKGKGGKGKAGGDKGDEAAAKAEGAKKWAKLLGLSKHAKAAKAEKVPPPTAAPLPAGSLPTSLAQAVASFSTFEGCIKQIERRLPPDLGADMLKYYNLPDGLCRTREALKQKDITACDRALSYSLKKGCKIMYGIYHQQPDLCPRGYPKRRGRNGYCIALAKRDVSLCRAAKKEAEEVRCQAILGNDRDKCTQLSRLADRAKCKAEVRRWASVATAGTSSLPKDFKPRLELTLSMPGGGGRPLPFTTVEASCARFGVVAPESGFTAQVNGCEYYNYGYRRSYGRYGSYNYNSPQRRTKVDFSYKPPVKAGDTVTFGSDAKLKIKIRRFGEFVSTGVGSMRFSRFERKRGGRVTATFTATLMGAGDKLTVKGKLDTFIRDLVPASEMYRRSSRYGAYGKYGRYGKYGKYGRYGGTLGTKRSGRGLGGLLGKLSGRAGVNPNPYGARPAKRYAALLTAATLTQVTIGGKTGFQLGAIRPASVWERLGIKNGDVVFQVGSVKLENQGAVVRLRRELRDAKSLKVKLRRQRRNKTLRVATTALDKLRQEFRF
jgi:hypothetical protein